MAHLEDDKYEIPLRDQRYFGAGIKRKRVQFVPSTSTKADSPSLPAKSSSSASSRYLEIVLKGKQSQASNETPAPTAKLAGGRNEAELQKTVSEAGKDDVVQDRGTTDTVCEICSRAIPGGQGIRSHDSSIVHQICLQHSHPPSHVDRRRKGLQVLSSQGWDPDSRLGLGASGEGMLHPIKATGNPMKAGLGLRPEDLVRKTQEKPVKLDAGKVRALENERRKKGEKLREAFYRSEDVEKYLGDGAAQTVDVQAFNQARKNGLR